MPLWQGNNPIAFSPASVKGLVAWYDNTSTVDTAGTSNVTIWKDKTPFENHLIPYTEVSSDNCVHIGNYIYNSNTILRNSRLLEFQSPVSDAIIFCVAKPDITTAGAGTTNITNLFSLFTTGITTDTFNSSNTNLTVGITVSDAGVVNGIVYDNTFDTYNTNFAALDIRGTISANANIFVAILPILTGGDPQLFLGSRSGLELISSNSTPINLTKNVNNFNIFVGDSKSGYTAALSDPNLKHKGLTAFKEIIVYGTLTSDSDYQNIVRYLEQKHNL
jgi:hypothetical protein